MQLTDDSVDFRRGPDGRGGHDVAETAVAR